MFWAVFQWKLLQSDEAKEASMKGEVNNRRSRQSSEQGSQGRTVRPFFLPVASSQCSACLHYCDAHPLLHHCCFLHPQQTFTFLQYIQTQNTAQFFSYRSAFWVISRGLDNVLVQGFPSLNFAEWDDYNFKEKNYWEGVEILSLDGVFHSIH